MDLQNKTCLTCHKPSFRLWEHGHGGSVNINNTEVDDDETTADSENWLVYRETITFTADRLWVRLPIFASKWVLCKRKCRGWSDDIASNASLRDEGNDTPDDGPIPVAPLWVFNGKLNGVLLQVLRNDGCNTNVILQRLLDGYCNWFQRKKSKTILQYSVNGSVETAPQFVMNGTLRIEAHRNANWVSRWLHIQCSGGNPRHAASNPQMDYVILILKTRDGI